MAETNISWPTIVTALVALYGAVLSTLNFIAARREKRRSVTVELSLGLLTWDPGSKLLLTASNPGSLSVTLSSCGIRLPNGKQAVFPIPNSNVRFPHELHGGKDCLVWTDAKEFAQVLREQGFSGRVKVRGFYRDQTGGLHTSKATRFDLDGW